MDSNGEVFIGLGRGDEEIAEGEYQRRGGGGKNRHEGLYDERFMSGRVKEQADSSRSTRYQEGKKR